MSRTLDRRALLRMGTLAAGAAALGSAAPAWADGADEADYVVIGSGPGGGPLAARLAAAGHSVVVLEAGPPTGNQTWYDVPVLHNKASGSDEQIRWDFYVRQYTDMAMNRSNSQWVPDRGVLYPRAATIGGCCAHNALITMYPEPSDWARIQRLTKDDGWSPDAMWNHWERVLAWQPVEFSDLIEQALNGAVPLDAQLGALVRAAKAEAATLGPADTLIRDMRAVNDRRHVDGGQGFVMPPMMRKNGKRYSVREMLTQAADTYPRLSIVTNALAKRILFERGPDGRPKAVGVEVLGGRYLYGASPLHDPDASRTAWKVRARKEVIVSGGAFNSPQLLMLSGIGPRDHLSRLGIPVLVDLPGVGTNLQDRCEVSVTSKHPDFFLTSLCTFDSGFDPCLTIGKGADLIGLNGVNPYSFNGVIGGIKSRYRNDPRAQLYIFGAPAAFRGYVPGYGERGYVHDTFTWLILKGYAQSRMGTVRLRSADATVPPDINFRKFDDGRGGDYDVAAMVDAVETVRRINKAAGVGKEDWPGPGVASRQQLAAWIRREAWGHHASCSNPIGMDGDPRAVLDGKFRVRGTTGLRVVDASSFPWIPGLFIWAPTAIISEKAAADILAESGGRRRVSRRLAHR